MRWDKMRQDEIIWTEIGWCKIRWGEMRRNGTRWDKTRWDKMRLDERYDEIIRGEIRWQTQVQIIWKLINSSFPKWDHAINSFLEWDYRRHENEMPLWLAMCFIKIYKVTIASKSLYSKLITCNAHFESLITTRMHVDTQRTIIQASWQAKEEFIVYKYILFYIFNI